jgi:hypothetical protein
MVITIMVITIMVITIMVITIMVITIMVITIMVITIMVITIMEKGGLNRSGPKAIWWAKFALKNARFDGTACRQRGKRTLHPQKIWEWSVGSWDRFPERFSGLG